MEPLFGIAGLVKGYADSKAQEEEQREQAKADAVAIKYSPWSGLNADKLIGKSYHRDSALSGALAGGAAGVQVGNNIANSEADLKYRNAVSDYYKSKTPVTTGVEAAKATAPAALSPYGSLDVSGAENLLKGQAVRNMPYGMGFGDA